MLLLSFAQLSDKEVYWGIMTEYGSSRKKKMEGFFWGGDGGGQYVFVGIFI